MIVAILVGEVGGEFSGGHDGVLGGRVQGRIGGAIDDNAAGTLSDGLAEDTSIRDCEVHGRRGQIEIPRLARGSLGGTMR